MCVDKEDVHCKYLGTYEVERMNFTKTKWGSGVKQKESRRFTS